MIKYECWGWVARERGRSELVVFFVWLQGKLFKRRTRLLNSHRSSIQTIIEHKYLILFYHNQQTGGFGIRIQRTTSINTLFRTCCSAMFYSATRYTVIIHTCHTMNNPFMWYCTKSGHVVMGNFEDSIEHQSKSTTGPILFTIFIFYETVPVPISAMSVGFHVECNLKIYVNNMSPSYFQ